LELRDGLLFANVPNSSFYNYWLTAFVVEDDIDWAYIGSLLDFDAQNPDPPPFPPDMMMYFDEHVNADGRWMYASRTVLSMKSKFTVGGLASERTAFVGKPTVHGAAPSCLRACLKTPFHHLRRPFPVWQRDPTGLSSLSEESAGAIRSVSRHTTYEYCAAVQIFDLANSSHARLAQESKA
jgi:hypothetical protein